MKSLEIMLDNFKLAFDRDEDYHDKSPQKAYMDRNTGDIYWVFENDDDAEFEGGIPSAENRKLRVKIAKNEEKYVEILGRSHGEQHNILKGFLDSDWTDNHGFRKHVKECYFGSIGGWIEEVDDQDVLQKYQSYNLRAREKITSHFSW